MSGRRCGRSGILLRRIGRLTHNLFGGRIDDVVRTVPGIHPLPTDQELMLVLADLVAHRCSLSSGRCGRFSAAVATLRADAASAFGYPPGSSIGRRTALNRR